MNKYMKTLFRLKFLMDDTYFFSDGLFFFLPFFRVGLLFFFSFFISGETIGVGWQKHYRSFKYVNIY